MKVILWPGIFDRLAIGDGSDALLPELRKKPVVGSLTVENHDKSMQKWICIQFGLGRLRRDRLKQLRNNLVDESGPQTFRDRLGDNKERATDGIIDPVVGGASKAELLP